MSRISKKKKKPVIMSEKDILKMEIAKELGVWDQVEREGWNSLSNAICGKVGGIMSRRLRDAGQ